MTKARDRADRSGSDPIQIGSTKLVTDSSNNLSVTDTSDAPKKLIASEIEIGDSSNKVIIKKGSDNKVAFQTQASGGSATDSNAGGGVTVVADLTALQAITGTSAGDLAFVTANSKVYLRTATGWYVVATVTNATPVISGAGNASYTFAIDGTPVVIDVTATDAEGETLTYAHTVSSGSASGVATITQGTGATVNRFTLTPATSGSGGSFSVTFTAQDPNGNTATSSASSFTLAFGGAILLDGTGDWVSGVVTALGTSDFTIECWIKPNTLGSNQGIIHILPSAFSSSGNFNGVGAAFNESNKYYSLILNGTFTNSNATALIPNTSSWRHVAIIRSGGLTRLFIDGSGIISQADTTNYSTSTHLAIGGWHSIGNGLLNGYISNVRYILGSTPYTISTPSAGSSFFNNGASDYMTSPNFPNLGAGDYTVEFWWKGTHTFQMGFLQIGKNNGSLGVMMTGSNKLRLLEAGGSTVVDSTTSLTTNTWWHIAIVNDGTANTQTIYLNGFAESGTGSKSTAFTFTETTLVVGASSNGSAFQNKAYGYISNLRITNTKVYTGNFAVPASPLTDLTGTQILTCQNSSGAITDASSNSRSITANGSVAANSNHPFIGTITVPTSALTAVTNTKLLTANDTDAIDDGSGQNVSLTANGNAAASSQSPF